MDYDRHGFVEGVDGTRLFFETSGAGQPTAVLIDGIGCDGFAWRYLQPKLAARHEVVHPHFRGHGRSGPPVDPARLAIEDLAQDIVDVCDHVGTGSLVLIAHSMGVQVALELYRRHPERVAGLVLMCGTFGRITSTFHGTDLLDQVLPTLVRGAQALPWLARTVWGRAPASLAFRIACAGRELDADRIQEEDFQRYWNHSALMDPNVFLPMLQLAGRHDAQGFLAEVRVPTLVIAAEHDTFTPMALAKEMSETIPDSVLEVIPEASHAAPVEQPDRIIDRIEKFVSTRLGTTAGP